MKRMHYYEVAPTIIVRAGSDSFTYASPTPLSIGQLVTIEVGKKQSLGLILEHVSKPAYDTKEITAVTNHQLPAQLISTARWMTSYYATPLATVLQTILPRGLQKNRRATQHDIPHPLRDRTKIVLTQDQRTALEQLEVMSPGTALLHGVTGSGKTRIYIEAAQKALAAHTSVIVLVPEIALTSQLVDEFSHHFADIILTHSRQTEAQRHLAWLDALQSTTPRVVIGPRSALFMPLRDIGLITIDEAHEPSFKQEQSPRYSALRTAAVLAANHHAKLILGSATPSIADYYLAKQSGRPIITLLSPAQEKAVKPDITLIDMTKRTNFRKHRFLSDNLITALEDTFTAGHQALIFHNRRGSASTTLCENCGWSAGCQRCFIPFTLHADTHELRCHICGLKEQIPTSCPVCSQVDIVHKGIGTKLIEAELKKLFPHKTILRFDADSESDASVEQKYKELYEGTIDLIIGTQVIAKGLDLPHLRTVGVVQADSGLSLPDFSSSERTFQLLAQVVGRVGRSHHSTKVIVQSYQPTHPAVVDGLRQDYTHFYTATIENRERSGFPPFMHLLKLTCIYKTEAAAIKNAKKLSETLKKQLPASIQVFGPAPAFYERQRDTYRWQLTLKSSHRQALVDALAYLPASHWQFELDPTTLL